MHSLIVSEQGTAVRAEGDSLLIQRGDSLLRRVRVADVDQVLLMGRVELSHGALTLLLRRGVDTVWLTRNGLFRGRLMGRSSKNVPLRMAQYRRSTSPEFCLAMARTWIAAKVRKQRQVLLRAQRRLQNGEVASALGQLRLLTDRVLRCEGLDSLRGLEGQAAAVYFGQFGKLLRAPEFVFTNRNRRPPRDPVNALLSFGYALLGSLLETEMLRCGLDPLLGFFHQPLYGRPALMLDLLEEFRPLTDTFVLRVVNRRQIGPGDFVRHSGQSLAELLQDEVDAGRAGPAGADLESTAPWEEEGAAATGRMRITEPAMDRRSDENVQPAPAAEEALTEDGGEETLRTSSECVEDLDCATRRVPEFGIYLNDVGRKVILNEWFRRLRERLYYPPRDASFELRDILRMQIYQLARVIDGTQDRYEPFVTD